MNSCQFAEFVDSISSAAVVPAWNRLRLLLTKIFRVQAAAFDDAFQRANRNRLAAVHGDDDLPAVFVPPFLVAARLTDAEKTVQAQNFDDFLGVADWIPPAHGTASSTSLESL